MVATPSAPWRRDMVALSDGAVSLDRLNPTHSYQIQLELRDGVGGATELYLFGGTPSEIERQLISLPAPAARRVSLVQITLGFDLYPVRLPMDMESRV